VEAEGRGGARPRRTGPGRTIGRMRWTPTGSCYLQSGQRPPRGLRRSFACTKEDGDDESPGCRRLERKQAAGLNLVSTKKGSFTLKASM